MKTVKQIYRNQDNFYQGKFLDENLVRLIGNPLKVIGYLSILQNNGKWKTMPVHNSWIERIRWFGFRWIENKR